MTSATVDTSQAPGNATVQDRVVDAYRHGAHRSHEARWLKSLAVDAVEDGVHAARRAIASLKRRIEELADSKDEAAHRRNCRRTKPPRWLNFGGTSRRVPSSDSER